MDKKTNRNEVLICFENVTEAIMAEKELIRQEFTVRVMPTPAGIKEGCGFCLRLLPAELASAAALLQEHGLAIKNAWEKSLYTNEYNKIGFT